MKTSFIKGFLLTSLFHLIAVGISFLLLLAAVFVGGNYLGGGVVTNNPGLMDCAFFLCFLLLAPLVMMFQDGLNSIPAILANSLFYGLLIWGSICIYRRRKNKQSVQPAATE